MCKLPSSSLSLDMAHVYLTSKNFGRLTDPRDAITQQRARDTTAAITSDSEQKLSNQVPGCFEYRIFGHSAHITIKPGSSRIRRPPAPTSAWSTEGTPPQRRRWRRRRMPSRERTSPRSCPLSKPRQRHQLALESERERRISTCQTLKGKERGARGKRLRSRICPLCN